MVPAPIRSMVLSRAPPCPPMATPLHIRLSLSVASPNVSPSGESDPPHLTRPDAAAGAHARCLRGTGAGDQPLPVERGHDPPPHGDVDDQQSESEPHRRPHTQGHYLDG